MEKNKAKAHDVRFSHIDYCERCDAYCTVGPYSGICYKCGYQHTNRVNAQMFFRICLYCARQIGRNFLQTYCRCKVSIHTDELREKGCVYCVNQQR